MNNLLLSVINSSIQGKNYFYETYFKKKFALDIGCGTGQFVSKNPKKIIGIDTNIESISVATGAKKIIQASACDLPFKPACFEAINCNNVIEHLYPYQAYQLLRESARVLRPAGFLIIHTQMATKRSWETFSHARPYPPISLLNITGDSLNKEDYPAIKQLRPVAIYYEGPYASSRLLFAIGTCLSAFLPFFRRDFTLVFQKDKSS